MITPRLKMITDRIDGKTAADVGTDHGYAAVELARRGISVIATDVNEGPLAAARANTEKFGVTADLRLGSGLALLNLGEADCIIIAGMGGELIEKIITADMEKARAAKLLLQPMNSQCELRKFLIRNGFCIIDEDLAKEGHKIYNLIVARAGKEAEYPREIDYHLPKLLYGNPLFGDLAEKKMREFKKIHNGLLAGGEKRAAEEYGVLLNTAREIYYKVTGGRVNEDK